ncbi:hypothetical protein J6TS7_38070 [Paenibacillus dendritiformis]|nr:hypothetical protein J6TS7_38070 [Paenibacillus dendritiformis]
MGGRRNLSRKGGDACERIRSTIRHVPIWTVDIRVIDVRLNAANIPAHKEIDRPQEGFGLFPNLKKSHRL